MQKHKSTLIPTFERCFNEYIELQEEIVTACTTAKYKSDQMDLLQEQFKYFYRYKADKITIYAVNLRVGELSALKWDSINKDCIIIRREEIYDRADYTFKVMDFTKNKKPRVIPMINEVKVLLEAVKKIEKTMGWYGEYLFMDDNGKVNKRHIGDCARLISERAGFDINVTVHTYRRTLNSVMKNDGVSTKKGNITEEMFYQTVMTGAFSPSVVAQILKDGYLTQYAEIFKAAGLLPSDYVVKGSTQTTTTAVTTADLQTYLPISIQRKQFQLNPVMSQS